MLVCFFSCLCVWLVGWLVGLMGSNYLDYRRLFSRFQCLRISICILISLSENHQEGSINLFLTYSTFQNNGENYFRNNLFKWITLCSWFMLADNGEKYQYDIKYGKLALGGTRRLKTVWPINYGGRKQFDQSTVKAENTWPIKLQRQSKKECDQSNCSQKTVWPPTAETDKRFCDHSTADTGSSFSHTSVGSSFQR